MDDHQKANNTPRGRRSMIQRLAEGWTTLAVAAALGVDPEIVRKWRDRGKAGPGQPLVPAAPQPDPAE
jgi:transposase-like protein